MSFELNEKAKKTFCPLAWNHSFVNQDGSFQVCCTSEEFDNHIRGDKTDKPIYITDGLTAQEVMNSNYMKNIRQMMLNGKLPILCSRCVSTERMGGVSRRQVEIMNYEKEVEAMVTSTTPEGDTSYKITSADYRLGNLCNLQCRMCNPRSTKLWIKEWNDMKPQPEKFNDEKMASFSKYDWIDSDNLLRDFEEKAPNLKHIHFAGGEPLLVPQMSKVLQRCIDSGNAKNIVLTYNTNLTVLPQKVLELWKHFAGVKILASVDAIGDLAYYIRYPSNWAQIDKNIRFIEEHHAEYNITECLLSTTVQVLNILHLPKIYDYLSQFKFIVRAPNLINLYFPRYFQTTVLPAPLKKLASIQLLMISEKLQNEIPPHFHYLLENITTVVNFMNSRDDTVDGGFNNFYDFQLKFDQKKKLNLLDYCPEFRPFLPVHQVTAKVQDT